MSKIRSLIEELIRTVGGEHAQVPGPVTAELLRVRLVITATLIEFEGMVSDGIGDVRYVFPVDIFSGSPGPSTQSSYC